MDTEEFEEEIKEKFKYKRICESNWHKQIELKECEECPICKSVSKHTVVKILK